MSFKDEIERIAKDERQKIEANHQRVMDSWEQKQQHFKPLRGLVQELVDSVDPAYLEVKFYPVAATLEMGMVKNGERSIDVSWSISPQDGASGFEIRETKDRIEKPRGRRSFSEWDWPNFVRSTETLTF